MTQIAEKVGDNSVHLGDMTFLIAGIDFTCKNRLGTAFWRLKHLYNWNEGSATGTCSARRSWRIRSVGPCGRLQGPTCRQAKGNIKKTWELINELRGKSKSDIKASFIIDGKVVTERREIANGFNIFFSSIAKKLNCKVQSSRPSTNTIGGTVGDWTFRNYLKSNKNITNSIFFRPCDQEEIEKVITEFENGKASDISVTVLKKSSIYIAGHLSRVIVYIVTAWVARAVQLGMTVACAPGWVRCNGQSVHMHVI